MQLEVKGHNQNVQVCIYKYIKSIRQDTTATSDTETQTNAHACILPLCTPFKLSLTIFVCQIFHHKMSYLRAGLENQQLGVQTEVASVASWMHYRDAPPPFQSSPKCWLAWRTLGNKGSELFRAQWVNASSSPAHAEQLCGTQPQKCWKKIPHSINHIFLWSGILECLS